MITRYFEVQKSVQDMKMEVLIDKLHSLACQGKMNEAKKVASRIKQLQTSGT